MSLLRLPDELLLEILQWAFPEGLMGAVLACRRLYQMAGKWLEKHRQYTDKYMHKRIAIHWSGTLDPSVPLQLIRLLLEDPDMGYYIRDLNYSIIDYSVIEWELEASQLERRRALKQYFGTNPDGFGRQILT